MMVVDFSAGVWCYWYWCAVVDVNFGVGSSVIDAGVIDVVGIVVELSVFVADGGCIC